MICNTFICAVYFFYLAVFLHLPFCITYQPRRPIFLMAYWTRKIQLVVLYTRRLRIVQNVVRKCE